MPAAALQVARGFAHGVHPPECKERTRALPIRRLPFPPMMVVPMAQHTGAPARPVVRQGQEVVRGEPIAEAVGFVSVPMHAPATGVVEKIALAPTPKGDLTEAIYIRLYPAASQQVLFGAPQDIDAMTTTELIAAVQRTGVVGLGGAAFPTHVKLKPPEGMTVDTVIANGCECEPYLTTDHRVMLEQVEEIIAGMRIVMKALKAPRGMIGIEDNKLDAGETLAAALAGEDGLSVGVVPTKYPQGAEKMLVKALLNREIPVGGLPAHVGTAVFNVATLAQIGDLLPRHQGLIERVVTITGPGVSRPGNYRMPLGTPLRFVLQQAGFQEDSCTVVLGGPMMGGAVSSLEVPITKGITGILVLTRGELSRLPERAYPCIKCGSCVDVCPLSLNPQRLGSLARKERYREMEEEFHLGVCFECGCCSYVCPADIPLVQLFRIAKAANRKRKTE